MSSIVNKVKEAVTGDKQGHHTASDSTGPHPSSIANKVDPRVDSDQDHRANPSSTSGSTGISHGTAAHDSSNAGPYRSNVLNKVDPRVDSGHDHRANPSSTGLGAYTQHTSHGPGHIAGPDITNPTKLFSQHTSTSHHQRPSNVVGTGTASTGHGSGYGVSSAGAGHGTTGGPHDSNLANKLDPRVASDKDDSKTYPGKQTGL